VPDVRELAALEDRLMAARALMAALEEGAVVDAVAEQPASEAIERGSAVTGRGFDANRSCVCHTR
jgi:hypothetical protein